LTESKHQPIRLHVRSVLRGRLRRLVLAVSVFEFGNVAVTLLILRATDLVGQDHGLDDAVQIALASTPATTSRRPSRASRAGGSATGATASSCSDSASCFAAAYFGFALAGSSILLLAVLFAAAGVGIGFVETAEHTAVATLAPAAMRGSAFGLLAAVQSFGNLAASAIAGLLWTLALPQVAFLYLATWMLASLVALALTRDPGD
jgi:MFS family permease